MCLQWSTVIDSNAAKCATGPHLGHLVLDDLLDAKQLLRLQRRIEAPHLKCIQLRVVQRLVLSLGDGDSLR